MHRESNKYLSNTTNNKPQHIFHSWPGKSNIYLNYFKTWCDLSLGIGFKDESSLPPSLLSSFSFPPLSSLPAVFDGKHMIMRDFPNGSMVKSIQETWVWSLSWEDPLEKGMANHSSILAWRISWTEEPGRLQFIESQRVGHDWVTNAFNTFPQWLNICVPELIRYHLDTQLLCTPLPSL